MPVRLLDKPIVCRLSPIHERAYAYQRPNRIAFAKALLEGEDINCFEMDVHMSVLEGSIGVLPRRLMVRDEDHFRAKAVLKDNDLPVEE